MRIVKDERIKFAVEIIDRPVAEEYLALDDNNRPQRIGRIKAMSDDMRAGRWRLHHQGIAFDWNGRLRDGQHRLRAIIDSGAAVKMVVARDVDPAVFDAIDIGAKRTFTDIEVYSGHDVTKAHEATLRGMFTLSPSFRGTSIPTLREMWAKHGVAVNFSAELFGNSGSGGFQKGTNNGIIRAVVARAYYTQPHARLRQFADVLRTGSPIDPIKDRAAITLRNLLTAGKSGSRQDRYAVYKKSERALLWFLQGQPASKLYEASEELFPIEGDSSYKQDTLPRMSNLLTVATA